MSPLYIEKSVCVCVGGGGGGGGGGEGGAGMGAGDMGHKIMTKVTWYQPAPGKLHLF